MDSEISASSKTTSYTEPEKLTFNVPKVRQSLVYWLGLIPVFILALFIRLQNLPLLKGKYLIELDSYFFFRYSKMLLEQGSVPAIDYMRYVPTGVSSAGMTFFPKTMVFFYKIIHIFFTNLSQIEWHIIYPPVITIISFVFFFLFVKEILGHRTAFIATAFLAVIPAYIQRTGAGFADHEAFGMLWMFISLWLFVLAWKSDNYKKFLPLAAISGLFAGIMAATWGGYTLFVSSMALFMLVYAILAKPNWSKIGIYGTWAIVYLISGSLFRYSQFDNTFYTSWHVSLVLLALLLPILNILLVKFAPKVANLKFPTPLIAGGILAAIALPISFLFNIFNFRTIFAEITKSQTFRLFYTVSENAQPYFSDWWGGFGWIFFLAFIGSVLCFYQIFKHNEKSKLKLHWLVSLAYVAFFIAFVFGRYSTDSKYSAIVSFFSQTYLYWIGGFIGLVGLLYLIAFYKEAEHIDAINKNWPWLFLSIWFLIVLIAARGQIRLIFATVPVMAIAAGVAISKITDWAKTWDNKIKYVTLGLLILFSIFAFATAAKETELQNSYSGSMTPGQWGDAMTWVRENTPANAVFAHWWDYGYMTIAVGNRSAVTDGGNSMGWNHQSGRYFLTGKEDNSTLTYLKTHNVTHILISEEEIPKYHAFSYVGSDENLDRRSTIGLFVLNQQKEVRDGTLFGYSGSWQLDKDYVLGKLVLSEQNAGIGGFSYTLQNNTITNPKAYLVSNGQQFEVPITCVYVQGKRLNFEAANNSLNGCLVLIPYFDQNGTGMAIGGAFWLSEKVWDTNMAKLYIYGEDSPYFKLAYSDDTPLGIYQGRIIGPIKIWEVEYPEDIKPDPFYMESSPYG
jgi:asparagine N-glycosylation enzyme membrane subunit Stt3